MARRTGLSREEIRVNALEAGRNVIIKEGIRKLSMRQIAKDIGYTVGTLYNVFKNQDDLLLQINGETLDKMHAYLIDNLKPELRGRDMLLSIARSYYTFARDNYHLWATLFEYSLTEEQEFPVWYLQKIAELINLAERAMDAVVTSQEVPLAARTLWASVHGICALGLSKRLQITSSGDPEALIQDLVDRYFAAL